jgi:anti-anti-sigma factor
MTVSEIPAAVSVTCRDERGATLVTVRGDLDIASVGLLEGRLRLDLSEVTFFDSSAVRALLEARQIALEDTGRTIELVATSHNVRRVLDMVATRSLFD